MTSFMDEPLRSNYWIEAAEIVSTTNNGYSLSLNRIQVKWIFQTQQNHAQNMR